MFEEKQDVGTCTSHATNLNKQAPQQDLPGQGTRPPRGVSPTPQKTPKHLNDWGFGVLII